MSDFPEGLEGGYHQGKERLLHAASCAGKLQIGVEIYLPIGSCVQCDTFWGGLAPPSLLVDLVIPTAGLWIPFSSWVDHMLLPFWPLC